MTNIVTSILAAMIVAGVETTVVNRYAEPIPTCDYFGKCASVDLGMMATNYPLTAPRVYFSPNYSGSGYDCASNLVAEIDKARNNIYVFAYQFTLPCVADALIGVKKKGVDVRIIVDSSATNTHNSKVSICLSNGIPVAVDYKHSIFHDKLMVIDGKTAITGSFNYTANAEYHNVENMWVIVDTNAATLCISNWMVHASHSVPLK